MPHFVPSNSIKEQHRAFFERLGDHLGFKKMEDWYNVNQEDINNFGGKGILYYYYSGSPSKAVQAVFSEHNWMTWRFNYVPKGYWKRVINDKQEQERIINWLETKLFIKSPKEWDRISLKQISRHITIKEPKVMMKMLQAVYPDHQWKPGKAVKAAQRDVLLAVKQLFPEYGRDDLLYCNI